MSRKRHRPKHSDSHPQHFSRLDLDAMALPQDRWLNYERPLEFLSVDTIRRAMGESLRGAWAQLQWLWEQLEPADSILATCVERRLGALKRIPWDIVKKEDLSDAEDTLAEAQLRTLRDLANAIENLDEGIAALAQASFRHYRHLQMLETEYGSLRLNITENWNWCRDGYRGPWMWNPAATYGLTKGEPLPVPQESIISRICPLPIDQPAMMLALDRKNARAQWLVFNGRYGVPPLFAIMPQGIDEATRRKYMDFARRCISNAAGVLPAGSDVKAVNPGATGPDTFSRLIDLSTQEMVLRATGGLMTMLTAPGAGTNTETGSAHQDAFDDLAAAEAEEIAAVLQESLFAPALDQWHPGQPHLVEFAMRRPDSDNATGTIANVASLATAGYRTDAAQVSDLTGLAVQDTGAPAAAAQPTPGGDFPALRSLHTRFAPTMLYPPARAAFDRAINSRLAPSTPSPDASAPLTQAELEALQSLSKGFDPDQLEADADTIYSALADAISPADDPDPTAENSCNQYKHEPGCDGESDTPKQEKRENSSEKKPEAVKPEEKKTNLNLTTEQQKEFVAIKPRRDHLQKTLMERIEPGETLPLNIKEPEVSQAVLYRKQIKEMLTDKAIKASIRNGCPAEAHLEAVERTPEIIRGAKIVSYQTPTKPEDAGKIAKITHLENDFKAKSGDDFIAHWSVHHPVNKDLPPRLYFLFLRK